MRLKSTDVLKGIVMAVGVAGILAVAIVAPNLPAAFGQFYKPNRKYKPNQLKRSLDYAKKKELISIGQDGDKTIVKLTKAGKDKLLKYKLDDLKLSRAKKWDHKWRIVISDIPENLKTNRDAFSFKIKEIGFRPLQKSVWVWPYECQDEVTFLKAIYEVESFTRYITADHIENEEELLHKFGIS